MPRKTSVFVSFVIITILGLAIYAVAGAQFNEVKTQEEGLAGNTGSARQQTLAGEEKPFTEGEGAQAAGSPSDALPLESKPEGQAGRTGYASGVNLNTLGPSLPGLKLVYRFNGVTDDGAKGASTRKEATSVHCTNIGTINNQVEVQLFQWSGAMVYTGTVSMAPDASFTFSTQNTTIYFDDLIFGSGGGTDAIFQGSAQVWGETNKVICTAQALDPLGYPPEFAVSLEMYQE